MYLPIGFKGRYSKGDVTLERVHRNFQVTSLFGGHFIPKRFPIHIFPARTKQTPPRSAHEEFTSLYPTGFIYTLNFDNTANVTHIWRGILKAKNCLWCRIMIDAKLL